MNVGGNEEFQNNGPAVGYLDANYVPAVSPLSRRCDQISAPANNISRDSTMCNTHINSEYFSGYIFMCNGRTKPECYLYRVFGLPAGRREVIEMIKPGMKLFLFDYDVKYLYGVYEATTAGKLNLDKTAFGGNFPAQVRFHIYKECLPLPESCFKHAIQDNYQKGSKKFNPILSSQQVSHLLSMFNPLTTSSSAKYDHYAKENFQSTAVLPPAVFTYFNAMNTSHVPQASVPPSYSSMYSRLTSPALEPQYTQTSVLHPQHVGYGYAAQMGYNYHTVQQQARSAPNQTSYSVKLAGQSYVPEVPKSYERYEAAAQAMVPTHQHTGWRYEYNELPSQMHLPRQENASQHRNLYQVPAAHHVSQPLQQHASSFEEPGPAVGTLPISSSNPWTLQI